MSLKQLGVTMVVLGLLAGSTTNATVIAVGELSGVDGSNWVTNGLATLNGATAGVNWCTSGEQQEFGGGNGVWSYQSDYSNGGTQGTISGQSIEWRIGSGSIGSYNLGYETALTNLSLGTNIATYVGSGNLLRISMVAPTAGTFSLNGVSVTASVVGKVLQWTESNPTADEVLQFRGPTVDTITYNSGPIAFSAAPIPEPSTFVLFSIGLISLLAYAWRKQK